MTTPKEKIVNPPAATSAHSLRVGFVTYAHLRGASGRAIAHQTPYPYLLLDRTSATPGLLAGTPLVG